jgi:hypothetical protein
VTLRNNLLRGSILFLGEVPEPERASARKNWHFDHNGFAWRDTALLAPTDVVGLPEFLSVDPTDRDYLRVPANGRLGAGGEWPSYIGALPPGPAPAEGDWFTRLQERWAKVAPTLRDGDASPSPE